MRCSKRNIYNQLLTQQSMLNCLLHFVSMLLKGMSYSQKAIEIAEWSLICLSSSHQLASVKSHSFLFTPFGHEESGDFHCPVNRSKWKGTNATRAKDKFTFRQPKAAVSVKQQVTAGDDAVRFASNLRASVSPPKMLEAKLKQVIHPPAHIQLLLLLFSCVS